MKIGYARASLKQSNESLETQRKTLEAAGCEEIFIDEVSGAQSSRPALDAALAARRTNEDVLVVTRVDRLGRTSVDALSTIRDLADRGIGVLVLDPELDTRDTTGQLAIMVASRLAELEREQLVERTREGVTHARSQGRVAGPKPKLSREQVEAVRAAVHDGQPITAIAKSFHVSRPTIYRVLKDSAR